LLVDAEFSIEGTNVNTQGINSVDRPGRVEGINDGLSAPNRKKWTMHAEIDAMTQAYDTGVKGGHGVLKIDGPLNMCPYCKGDVKTMARKLNLDSLTIIDADGTKYFFDKKGLNKIKDGGMGYKKAKVHH
jgi:hypothetical protein